MNWTTVTFGRYRGKNLTLPQLALKDPDYFFWAYEKEAFENNLEDEAEEIYQKATSIRIPATAGDDMEVEYLRHPFERGLASARIVPRSQPQFKESPRTEAIDLRVPRRMKKMDRVGNDLLIRFLKKQYFGSPDARLTKKRCEEFFETDENFDL
ncbi:MAG: hypothetical protein KAV87_41285, partial [Desulfobacteraceae bacterium]|nr:hypothetical protein [Desulfobacteraceae bacterium]